MKEKIFGIHKGRGYTQKKNAIPGLNTDAMNSLFFFEWKGDLLKNVIEFAGTGKGVNGRAH